MDRDKPSPLTFSDIERAQRVADQGRRRETVNLVTGITLIVVAAVLAWVVPGFWFSSNNVILILLVTFGNWVVAAALITIGIVLVVRRPR